MRRLSLGIVLLAGCEWPEYWLDSANPANLNSRIDVVTETPAQMAPKSRTALRVIVTESNGAVARPASGLPVSIFLEDSKRKRTPLFDGKTANGACEASFVVPDLPDGDYTIKVRTRDYELRNPVHLKRDYRILLTSDKPLYQPGQKMRLRAIALANVTLKPVEKEKLTFEVEDAKGNKVFKKSLETSEFGIASADFQLADEVVMGDYKISAILGEVTSSRTIGVKRYVLPKFRVALETDRPFYLPGEKLRGTVSAEYFFGKPVAGEVVVKLLAVDVEVKEVAKATGTMDTSGRMSFEIPLDSCFVGLPINKGQANVLLAAQVTDSAAHAEKASRAVPVAKEALQIAAVPESGRLVPGVQNRIYVATYTPDGQAAPSEVTLEIAGWKATEKGDEGGVALFTYTPTAGVTASTITAVDSTGRKTTADLNLMTIEAPGGLLVRPDRALYSSGTTMNVNLYSTVRKGTAFLDLVRTGQTLLTASVPLEGGAATYAFDIPPDLFGAIEVRAYCVMPNGDILRDSRLIYVNAANDLKIDVVASKDVYEPGEDATIRFHVSDRAALGISIVDEAVYALQEMRPGLEKVYFTIEKELQEPKYGIKTLPEAIERRQDAVALMILASAETEPAGEVSVHRVVNTLEQRQRVMKPRLDRWYRAFQQYIVEKEERYAIQSNGEWKWNPDFLGKVSQSSHVKAKDMKDAWGNPISLATLGRLDPRFTLEYWMERRKP